jgi:hypothetical protein
MRLSVLCALVGALWGIVIGVAVAVAIVALGAGISWIFLFGDDPWPAAVNWVLPLLGAVGGVAVLAGAIVIGWLFGRRAERRPPAETATTRRWARALLALALATIAAGGALAVTAERRETARRDAAVHQKDRFAALLAERQTVHAITVDQQGQEGALRVSVTTRGGLDGAYALDWAVRETAYKKVLDEGHSTHQLTTGANTIAFAMRLLDLARSYHQRVLGGRAAEVLVDEDFRLELTLTPLLDEAARASLPSHERHNLDLGDSPLVDTARTDFRVRFEIHGDRVTLTR